VGEPVDLAKARLLQLEGEDPKPGTELPVQFNPDSLKVSYANQVIQVQNAANPQDAATQWVGQGTTKLSLQLVFDVTAPPFDGKPGADVRRETEKVIALIEPGRAQDVKTKGGDPQTVHPPPKVRFQWGTFRFDGMVDGIEEALEFFSPDGRPLRSTIGLTLSTQKVSHEMLPPSAAQPAGAPAATPGAKPLTPAGAGLTLQGMAEAAGVAASWPSIAAANGIENPRLLAPGQLVDLHVEIG
jgi:hypothetical protein